MGNYSSERVGSRFIKGRRQEALSQIEGWVGGSRAEIIKAGAAKVASHPPKNITEQKMLDSHLYDMSRQRFNFLLHCEWKRKLFLENQKRKTAVMRDLLRNVHLSNSSVGTMTRSRATTSENIRKIANQSEKQMLTEVCTEQQKSFSSDSDIFVTRIFRRPNTQSENTKSLSNVSSSSNSTSETAASKTKKLNLWPLNDDRYLRLNQALSENYPKEIHIQMSREHQQNLHKVSSKY